MGWHYLEPRPRAYQGQAWKLVRLHNVIAEPRLNAMLFHALVDVRPETHDDHVIRPAIARAQIQDLADMLDGTFGMNLPALHAEIAQLTWVANSHELIITHRAGTAQQRIHPVAPDDRGLYTVVFDAMPWQLNDSEFTGRQALERAWCRLDLARQAHRNSREDEPPQQILSDIGADAGQAIGEILAQFLTQLMPRPQHEESASELIPDMLARILSSTAKQLRATGAANVAHALVTDALAAAMTTEPQPPIDGPILT